MKSVLWICSLLLTLRALAGGISSFLLGYLQYGEARAPPYRINISNIRPKIKYIIFLVFSFTTCHKEKRKVLLAKA